MFRRTDALVPALVAVAGLLEIVAIGAEWIVLATFLVGAATLVAARVAPPAVPPAVALVWAGAMALDGGAADPASWVVLLTAASFAAGLFARPLASLASVAAALAIVMAAIGALSDVDPSLPFGLVATVGPWAVGAWLRAALEREDRLGVEAEYARLGRAFARERAADAERERIAGELHDVLAHTLGAMVLQASVAGDRLRRDPAAAADALREVARSGREGLAETGRLLRLIRDEDDEPAPAPEPAAPRSRRATDLVVPAMLAGAAGAEIAAADARLLAVTWVAAALLAARRAVPLAMPVAVTAVLLVGGDEGPAAWIVMIALACLTAGLHQPRVAAGLAAVVTAAALTIVVGDPGGDAVLVLALGVGAWAAGLGLRTALQRGRAHAAAAERERLEQELERERGAAAERRRIARELHDVLANSLSVMIVQASLGADLAGRGDVAAAGAVAAVEEAGRAALADIGRLLREIRDSAPTEPQHGVADLPALADQYARAGLGIDLHVDDVALPIGLDLSTYRIVQEALTNALKHAPGSDVRVRLERDGDGVAVEVRNGRAGSPALAVPGGHGLAGLRERVELFGGRIDAGPTADGGFVLAATLPIEAA